MKCALVIPSWSPGDIFPAETASSQVNYWEPLGTLYVGAALREAGHEVKLFNGAFLAHAEIVQGVADYNPGFTGVYSTTFGWPGAVRTVADIKGAVTGTFTAVGGPYPMAAGESCLEDTESLDAVVTGEGERTAVEMLDRVGKGESLDGVDGVAYREGGSIRSNAPRPLITDLDSIPLPARALLGEPGSYLPPPATYRRQPVAVLMTSRGCSRRCIYCFQADRERETGVRYRSVENVLSEIELCLRLGYREIKFIDDTLASDYDRAMALAEGIAGRGLDFTWFASACVNQVDEPLLRAAGPFCLAPKAVFRRTSTPSGKALPSTRLSGPLRRPGKRASPFTPPSSSGCRARRSAKRAAPSSSPAKSIPTSPAFMP